MSADTQGRKKAATTFLELVVAGRVRDAYAAHIGTGFRHHNPYFKGDAASIETGMADDARQHPGKEFRILRAVEEGDLVAVHSRMKHPAVTGELSVVHLFRFEGDRIAELWDIAQEMPADSPNENGAF